MKGKAHPVLLFNAGDYTMEFKLPQAEGPTHWEFVLDTSRPELRQGLERFTAGNTYRLSARTLAILKRPMR